jgi:hypothetical protein
VFVRGSADLPGLGDQVLSRVLDRELRRRLPDHRVTVCAPFGALRPSITDGGLAVLPLLGTSTGDDGWITVVCPGFPVDSTADELVSRYGTSDAAAAPPLFACGGPNVVWTAVRVAGDVPADLAAAVTAQPCPSVRDGESARRLRAAGVDVPVVAHPGVLAGAVVDGSVLASRLRVLRQLKLVPDNDYTVVHAPGGDLAGLASTGDGHVVVLPTAPVEGGVSWATVLPADLVLEDRLAVLAGARAVIAADEHVAAVAAGLGRPWALLDRSGVDGAVALEFGRPEQVVSEPGTAPDAVAVSDVESAVAGLTEHLDRVAELVTTHGHPVSADVRIAQLAAENRALRISHERLRQRMMLERRRLVESLADTLAAPGMPTVEPVPEPVDQELATRLAESQRELDALRGTKLLRWSAPLRRLYGKLRRT